jgi:hypothetical protein
MNKEEELMALLYTVISLQMSVEGLEKLQKTPINKQKIKNLVNQLIKEIDPIVEKNYHTIFNIDESMTQSIISNFENHIKQLSTLNIPDGLVIRQMIDVWGRDKLKTEIFLGQF